MILKEKLDALENAKLINKTLVFQYLFLIISLLFTIFISMQWFYSVLARLNM